jgi:hypothetical protein
MTYKIIQFNEGQGQIIVEHDPRFSAFAVDLPIDDNGLYITGEALDNYIKGFIPHDYVTRIDKINAGVSNAHEIAALVTPLPIPAEQVDTTQNNYSPSNIAMWSEVEFQKNVGDALVKLGVLSSNPANIKTTAL